MKNVELYNLCFSCLVNSSEHQPITEEAAADLLDEWQEEGCDLSDLDAADLCEVWNQVFYQMHFKA